MGIADNVELLRTIANLATCISGARSALRTAREISDSPQAAVQQVCTAGECVSYARKCLARAMEIIHE